MKLNNDRQRQAKTGKDPGKCKQKITKYGKLTEQKLLKSNLNTAFQIPDVVQCQASGSTGRANDHVYFIPDFPGYYTKQEFWTGI